MDLAKDIVTFTLTGLISVTFLIDILYISLDGLQGRVTKNLKKRQGKRISRLQNYYVGREAVQTIQSAEENSTQSDLITTYLSKRLFAVIVLGVLVTLVININLNDLIIV